MTPEELEEILDILQSRGEWAFELALRQVYVNAIAWTIIAVIIAAAGVVLFRFGLDSDGYDADFALILGGLIVFIAIFIMLGPPLGAVANPEYHALKSLLS